MPESRIVHDEEERGVVAKWGRYAEGEAASFARTAAAGRRSSAGKVHGRAYSGAWPFAATDLLCFVVATVAAGVGYLREPATSSEVLLAGTAIVGWLATFAGFGLYRSDLLSAPEELRRIVGATSLGVVLVIVEGTLFGRAQQRVPMVTLWLVVTVCELGTRRVWRWYLGRLRAAGSVALPTLVVGTDAAAAKAGDALADRGSGFRPIGFVATASSISYPGQWPAIPSPVVGAIEDLEPLVGACGATCVFVVSGCVSSDEMLHICRVCRRMGVDVRVSANLPETLTSRVTLQDVNGTMALCLRPVRLRGANAILKRGFDIVVASVGLVVVSLPSLLAICAVRLTSPGPALFRQERVTRGGRRFTIYKFRTMRCGADEVDTSAPFFKLVDDPRVTRVGAFLRRFSVDEWPQLWNVLKGEMSLVGPRPLAVQQVDNVAQPDVLLERQEVRAGLTGWWQVNGRNDVTPEEAFRLDGFYVENWSLALDLYILLKTTGTILTRRGAY